MKQKMIINKTMRLNLYIDNVTYNDEGDHLIVIKSEDKLTSSRYGELDTLYLVAYCINLCTSNYDDFYKSKDCKIKNYIELDDINETRTFYYEKDILEDIVPHVVEYCIDNKIPPVFRCTEEDYVSRECGFIDSYISNNKYKGMYVNEDRAIKDNVRDCYNISFVYDNNTKLLVLENPILNKEYNLNDMSLKEAICRYNKEWNEKSIGNFEW